MENDESITASNILSFFDTTRSERVSFAEDIVTRLEKGYGNPLRVLGQMDAVNEIIKICTERNKKSNKHYKLAVSFQALVSDEYHKHGGKRVELYNSVFDERETGTRYDYTQCNHPGWDEVTTKIAELKKVQSEIETFLKAVPAAGIEQRFGDELVLLYPPSKTSTTTVICTPK